MISDLFAFGTIPGLLTIRLAILRSVKQRLDHLIRNAYRLHPQTLTRLEMNMRCRFYSIDENIVESVWLQNSSIGIVFNIFSAAIGRMQFTNWAIVLPRSIIKVLDYIVIFDNRLSARRLYHLQMYSMDCWYDISSTIAKIQWHKQRKYDNEHNCRLLSSATGTSYCQQYQRSKISSTH